MSEDRAFRYLDKKLAVLDAKVSNLDFNIRVRENELEVLRRSRGLCDVERQGVIALADAVYWERLFRYIRTGTL